MGDRNIAKKSVYDDLQHDRDQIWAEAVMRWRTGEKLYLPPELEKLAEEAQEAHREEHPWEATVAEFLNKEVPADWGSWDLSKRLSYWSGGVLDSESILKVPRDKICCREIWQEAFGKDLATLTTQNARAINAVIESQDGWKKIGLSRCGVPYGPQKAYSNK